MKEVNERINTAKNKTIVDVFDEAGITSMALDAEGNLRLRG